MVTPNLFEAAILAGVDPLDDVVADVDAMVDLAGRIHGLGATWVLVKGGHLPGVHAAGSVPAPDRVADVLFDGTDVTVLEQDSGGHPEQPRDRMQPGVGHRRTAGPGSRRPRPPWRGPRPSSTGPEGAAGWDLGQGHGPLDPFGWSRD